MKKFLSLFAIAMMLFATSCSQEELAVVTDGTEVPVVFSAQLPQEMVTRVYSDGKTAKTLHYAVYVVGDNKPKFQTTAQFDENLQAQVNLTLATGLSYDIIFWAQSDAANEVYSLDWEAKTMKVNYDKMKANDENNDAFYAYRSNLKVTAAVNEDIKLYRPFAQINLGTNDFDLGEKAGLFPDRSSMKANLPNVLNFVDGSVSGEAEVTIGVNAFSTTEGFPVTGYDYLEMNYVLTDTVKSLINCTFSIWEKNASTALNPAITVSNVPVQRNYRTNIYGALLTDPAAFEVEIIPAYNEPDKDKPFDNNPTSNYIVEVDANGGRHFTVYTGEGLAAVSKLINDSTYIDANITLAPKVGNVINMEDITFEPICKNNNYRGTFDGNNVIIKNLTVNNTGKYNGLFGEISDGSVVKNVTLENCHILGDSRSVGGIAGRGSQGRIINCHIRGNSTITSIQSFAGGIIGDSGSYTDIIGCSVEEATISGKSVLGGISSGGYRIYGCSVKSTTLKGGTRIGGISGSPFNPMLITACHVHQVNIESDSEVAGGIIGYYQASGFLYTKYHMTNCYAHECTLNGVALEGGKNIIGEDKSSSIKTALYYTPWTANHTGNITGYNTDDTATTWEDIMVIMNTGIATHNIPYKWSGNDAASATLVVVE